MTSPDSTTANELVLTPPAPVKAVEPANAAGMLPLEDDKKQALQKRAQSFVDTVSALDFRSEEFRKKVEDIVTMGDEDIRKSASTSNRMLQRPIRALDSTTGKTNEVTPQKHVSDSLLQLRNTVEDLDPAGAQLSRPRKLLGFIPFGSKVVNYFDKYASAQSHLDGIIRSLKSGQDELIKDNASIEGEKSRLWEAMTKLQEYTVLAEALDNAIAAKADEVRMGNPELADAITKDLLFPVRQKHTDLLTQIAVSAQGYMALDMIRRNNTELIRGVERATTTTVSALRTAVTVAGALQNQRLVLDQIDALNSTTSDLIVNTSRQLQQQSADIQRQASSSSVSMEALREAFDNIYTTMDAIDTFKLQAADNLGQTITSLREEIGHATEYLERARDNDPAVAAATRNNNALELDN